ncbi:PHD finger protein 24 isoform X2 [Salmo salar]|uniref:PHD finger protein 24 isoform X2 n=1 Tax=Salmo salar TaxID=8030 RepID=A0A1S3L0G6_SALSA|nr:PHD finger protein 24-like isoform X2 [Salmo salar]|eukprot:XP_013984049.1 PREDICTED: protein KIAA1045 homolog isoform X2 [Salmo salar]
MGVLMSKKHQVEKVQKCTSVVSAFQQGVKERAPSTTNQGEGSKEEREGPTEASPPPNLEEKEEAEHREADSKAGPSGTSQQAATPAPTRDECKVNQEAWNRLRDGKGVEPEDLDKTGHQLTPPAFVRPKRDANVDQPMEVALGQREQPVNDEMCEVCEVWTADDLFPCRTCTRVFHDGCLSEMGYLRTELLQEMRETAHTATGWSCYYCDNVNLLLTEEEMYSLMETFKQCKIIPESCLVSDELLQYRHFVSKQLFEKDLSDEQEEEVLAQFAALDPEKRGQIEWSDFLYHESLGVLKKFRTENSLVRLLSAKERDHVRSVFMGLDLDKDGVVTGAETRWAQQSWFQKLSKESQSCNVSISHVGPISDSSPASSSSERSTQKDDRPVSWDDFLRESAIYILAARPNSSAMHIRLPL